VNLGTFLSQVSWRDFVDVLLVAVVVYHLLKLIRGTRAASMLLGMVFVGALYWQARLEPDRSRQAALYRAAFRAGEGDWYALLASARLAAMGETPLPHYIKRETEPSDAERYQTIYAQHEGAVAAPTAGLHFSRELMKRMELKGIHFAGVTLHIGLGTFRPVEVEDLTKHKMDSEQVLITQEACAVVNKSKERKKNVCCVGTTTMRAIESSVSTDDRMKPYNGWTNKFIFPPYDFSIANRMITNFHMPESTLLMMVAAFGGYDNVINAYKVALKEKYRFYSYGDAMLILD